MVDVSREVPAARELHVTHAVSSRVHLVEARRPPATGRPPLLVVLHGQGQSGARQLRWMGPAVPEHFAAAFPDGLHPFEVRRPERPRRIGYGWYLYDGDRQALAASMAACDERLWTIVERAAAELGADPGRVWLAGFSQGAYQAQASACLHVDRVAGWIAQAGNFRPEYVGGDVPDLSGRQVLLQHGRADAATPVERAEETAALFRSRGADVTLQLHDAGHVITPDMASAARAWLEQRAPAR